MYLFIYICGFDSWKACIHVEVFCVKFVYKIGFCWTRCLINLISLVVFLLSANEVLLDDLGLIMMFWFRIDWLKNDEATRCLWLKISDGSMIILEWGSGYVYDSMFISEWQWFNFRIQWFRICTWICFMESAYARGFFTVK